MRSDGAKFIDLCERGYAGGRRGGVGGAGGGRGVGGGGGGDAAGCGSAAYYEDMQH